MRPTDLQMSAVFAAALLLAPSLLAQQPGSRSGRTCDGSVVEPGSSGAPGPMVWAERLCLKLRDDLDVEFAEGRLSSRTGRDLGQLPALLAAATIEPMVTSVPRSLLDEWHARACAVLPPGKRPGHLAHWFVVCCASQTEATALRDELLSLPMVTHCYRQPIFCGASSGAPASGGDPPPATPSFTHMQGTLFDVPDGLGLRRAHGILGARGQGVQLRMIEDDWYLDHEDISNLVVANFIGTVPPQQAGISNHGLAGASLLVADRNLFGLTGAVDEADIKFLSFTSNGGLVNTLSAATASVQSGDVLVMALMFLLGQLGPDDWVPFEFLQAEFDAVLTSTTMGRIVVASVGNGHRSLDAPRHYRRFDRTYRDSGAIFVGATDGVALARASFCNFGSIVDSNSWGENVVTAGYGTLFYGNNEVEQSYTAQYAGTSASVPLVCAVVTALQGAARRQLERDLTGLEIRQLLRDHGTVVPGAIGRRPDMHAMLTALGVLDGLELSAPDLEVGNSILATLSGNGLSLLFASLAPGRTDLGLNRPLHLDLSSLVTFGFRLLSGSSDVLIQVPNENSLHGIDLFIQAGVQPATGTVHLTNSCQLTVL